MKEVKTGKDGNMSFVFQCSLGMSFDVIARKKIFTIEIFRKVMTEINEWTVS